MNLSGDVVSNSVGQLYEWFGIEAIYPAVVRKKFSEVGQEDVEVTMSTNGGAVFAGQEIYDIVKNHPGKTTLKISGLVASIGTLISCGFDEVLISPVATFMIHNPTLGGVSGEKKDMVQAEQLLDTIEETLLSAYVAKTGLDKSGLAELMANQTFMTAQEAVDYGFADGFVEESNELLAVASFGGPDEAFIEKLKNLKDKEERDLVEAKLRFLRLKEGDK